MVRLMPELSPSRPHLDRVVRLGDRSGINIERGAGTEWSIGTRLTTLILRDLGRAHTTLTVARAASGPSTEHWQGGQREQDRTASHSQGDSPQPERRAASPTLTHPSPHPDASRSPPQLASNLPAAIRPHSLNKPAKPPRPRLSLRVGTRSCAVSRTTER